MSGKRKRKFLSVENENIKRKRMVALFVVFFVFGMFAHTWSYAADKIWNRHVIDDSSKGADGVRFGDFNKDGLPDITTGWEQGGKTKMYLNPGPEQAKKPWPSVTVGKTKAAEDAFFADLDMDGILDIISSTEDVDQKVYIHWGPKSDALKSESWKQMIIPESDGRMKAMFGTALQLDGKNGLDVVIGGKRGGSELGWYEAPVDARSGEYKYHTIGKLEWVMSIINVDMNGDGLEDILISDRKIKKEIGGAVWFENPGSNSPALYKPWKRHQVLAMVGITFIDVADIDKDGMDDVICPTRAGGVKILRRLDATGDKWEESTLPVPFIPGNHKYIHPTNLIGKPKAVKVGDMNGDGRMDICITCEGAEGEKAGVVWFEQTDKYLPFSEKNWKMHQISGPKGVKYDRIELYDFDNDGDLDLTTCEEITNLGVIWYENPTK